MLIVSPTIHVPEDELEFTFSRSSGPGGQNVNKVNSRVTLRWRPANAVGLTDEVRQRFLVRYASRITKDGDLLISCQSSRDQSRNQALCLEKLREMLASVMRRPKVRRPTRPTKGSQKRRLETKREQSDKKRQRRTPPAE